MQFNVRRKGISGFIDKGEFQSLEDKSLKNNSALKKKLTWNKELSTRKSFMKMKIECKRTSGGKPPVPLSQLQSSVNTVK